MTVSLAFFACLDDIFVIAFLAGSPWIPLIVRFALVLCSPLLERAADITALPVVSLDSSIDDACGVPMELSGGRGSDTEGSW
jgi:hypothetical protein